MTELKPPFPQIREELEVGRVIPFLGAGASLGSRDPAEEPWEHERGETLPTAHELAVHLARKASFPDDEPLDLPKVAQYFEVVAAGREPLNRTLRSIFDHDFPPTALHRYLAGIPSPLLVITTNYDDLIERAFAEKAHDLVVQTTDPAAGERLLWRAHSSADFKVIQANRLDIDLDAVSVVYKIHGAVARNANHRDQFVITEDDYIDFLTQMTKRRAIPAIFAEPFQTRPFLFLGYGLNDWNLRVVLNRVSQNLRKRTSIRSWAIQKSPSPLERRFWQERGVEVYDMPIEDFVAQLAEG